MKQHGYRIALCKNPQENVESLQLALGSAGYETIVCSSVDQIKKHTAAGPCTAAIVLLGQQPLSSHPVVNWLKQHQKETQIIVLASNNNLYEAFVADKYGIFWYLTAPYILDQVLFLVAKACVVGELATINKELLQRISSPALPSTLIGEALTTQQLKKQLDKVALRDTTLLLTGETGTGKTTAARYLHRNSARKDMPFVSLSCAAIPRDLLESELFGYEKGAFTGAQSSRIGSIELAHRGTLFLDEIGDLPFELQPKLLTVLQDKKVQRLGSNKIIDVDVRIVAATNKDLSALVAKKKFREDLFYRLNVVQIIMPPLRERIEDIKLLAENYLAQNALKRGEAPLTISRKALNVMQQYSWPGNIRELENLLERVLVFAVGDTIEEEDVRSHLDMAHNASSAPMVTQLKQPAIENTEFSPQPLESVIHQHIQDTLCYCNGDKKKAATLLGVSVKTIYNKIASS
jgi:DNA-binding NtrC family response regulator